MDIRSDGRTVLHTGDSAGQDPGHPAPQGS